MEEEHSPFGGSNNASKLDIHPLETENLRKATKGKATLSGKKHTYVCVHEHTHTIDKEFFI